MTEQRPAEVKATHLARKAVIYVRQSTGEQVVHNTGSTDFQRGQADWARAWGWDPDSIETVEVDLGLSGMAAEHRPGYQRFVGEIEQGVIGALLISDLTRAGRDAAEWYRLLNLCRKYDVLIVVAGKVYDPKDHGEMFFTRLIATIGEHENWVRRENMRRGRITKAKSGVAVTQPPAGYVRTKEGKWLKDPELAVRQAIEAVFRVFLEQRSCRRTVERLKELGVNLPRRRRERVYWVEPQVVTVYNILANPSYKGLYRYGHRQVDPARGRDGRGRTRSSLADPADVIIRPNQHEPYVDPQTWEQIQQVLKSNAPSPARRNAGPSDCWVQGLLFCDRHPTRVMTIGFKAKNAAGHQTHSYACRGTYEHDGSQCIRIAGRSIDDAVRDAVFERLGPPAIELIREAAAQAQAGESSELHRRRMELHRARQAADDLEYRYLAVDPKNRLVAGTLEKRWEEAKRQLRQLEGLDQHADSRAPLLDDAGFTELLELCADLHALWCAETTRPHDRKEIVRTMVQRVLIEGESDGELKGRILWADDFPDTPIKLKRSGYTRLRLMEMHQQGLSPETIARRLNDAGLATRFGNQWSEDAVRQRVSKLRRCTPA